MVDGKFVTVIGVLLLILGLGASIFFLATQSTIQPQDVFAQHYYGSFRCNEGQSWFCEGQSNGLSVPSSSGGEAVLGDWKVVVEMASRQPILGDPYCTPLNPGKLVDESNAYSSYAYFGCDDISTAENVKGTAYKSYKYTNNGAPGVDGAACTSLYPGNRFDHMECFYFISTTGDYTDAGGCTVRDYFYGRFECSEASSSCGTRKSKDGETFRCGGLRQDVLRSPDTSGGFCSTQFSVYYKGGLVNQTKWSDKSFLLELKDPDSSAVFRVRGMVNSHFSSSQQECWQTLSTYDLVVPSNAFVINISKPPRQVFEGSDASVELSVVNNWKPIKANLSVEVEIPTFLGSVKKTFSNVSVVPVGKSVHTIQVPTKQVTDEVRIKVWADILMDGAEFRGVNGWCYGDDRSKGYAHDLSQCGFVKIAEVQPETADVQINPKPLYLVDRGDCRTQGSVEGYYCSEDNGLYIRDDISDLTCFKIGCPVVSGKTYECTSSGLCAEKVFIYKDCTTNGCDDPGDSCDYGSGVCIRTEIFRDVVQCGEDVDCPVPCAGVTPTCDKGVNRCEFSGECKPTIVQCLKASDCPLTPCKGVTVSCSDTKCSYLGECEPVYYGIDCTKAPCKEGYVCNTDIEPAMCQKEIYKALDCKDLGCPNKDYSCVNNSGSFACQKTEREYINIDCFDKLNPCPGGYSCIDIGDGSVRKGVCHNDAPAQQQGNLKLLIFALVGFVVLIVGSGFAAVRLMKR